LDDVGELVRDQPLSLRGLRGVGAGGKDHVVTHGVGSGADRTSRSTRCGVHVHPDGAEVAAERPFHACPDAGVQGLAGRRQHLVNRTWYRIAVLQPRHRRRHEPVQVRRLSVPLVGLLAVLVIGTGAGTAAGTGAT